MEQPAIMDVDAISTHSLTRRLTETTYYRKRKKIYFNSQPHKEADIVSLLQFIPQNLFQLTASQGG